MSEINNELLSFISSSPSVFHTILSIRTYLEDAGFIYLPEGEKWILVPGSYYTTRNDSSLIAFTIPEDAEDFHFQLCATHSDSPTFKLKNEPALKGPEGYLRLNVEPYGGMIDYTWFDRPLSIAGRVLVRSGNSLESRLVNITDTTLMIPSVPIHFNRDVNKGFSTDRQADMCPLLSAGSIPAEDLESFLAMEIGVSPENILGRDLYLVNRQQGMQWGLMDEFISAPRLDDLQAVFAAMKGFIAARQSASDVVNVFCCFDNEEVGSGTRQGADSTFLEDTLRRIGILTGNSEEDYYVSVAGSFLISFDNAHALHPGHPEKYDPVNRCYLNKGIVIKENASQRYTTDAFSRAIMTDICQKADVPYQTFANRSNTAGGSTLGNISTSHVSLSSVDIGLPQLAMHSSYETAGALDTEYAIKALTRFYSSRIEISGADSAAVR